MNKKKLSLLIYINLIYTYEKWKLIRFAKCSYKTLILEQ